MHPQKRGVQVTKPSVPSLVASSGEEDGGDGVTTIRRVQWMQRWRFIAALSLLDKEEAAEGVELQEETRISEDKRDIG